MKSLLNQLRLHFEAALVAAFGDAGRDVDPLIKAAADAKFGDYQSNVAMGLAKKLGAKPREVAQKIVAALSAAATELIDPPEIAGPGFINLRLKATFLQPSLESVPSAPEPAQPVADPTLSTLPGFDRLGIAPVGDAERQVVVIDYSSPNVAKQMHVGHLRSTIIGDTLTRVIEFQGHKAIRQNHIGDWGTPMGMVALAMVEEARKKHRADFGWFDEATAGRSPSFALSLLEAEPSISELEVHYRKIVEYAKQSKENEENIQQFTRHIQQGDATAQTLWSSARRVSLIDVHRTYARLGITLGIDSICGESFYDRLLPGIVEELRTALRLREDSAQTVASPRNIRAVCREDQGAICVFLEEADGSPAFKGPKGESLPMLIQKSDGAFLYATTDLAAILHRLHQAETSPISIRSQKLRESLGPDAHGLGATRVLYVVGAPQRLHFEMLFATARALGWTWPGNREKEVDLRHVPFGSVLGEDRKMLRTRTGESVKLKDLLDEAVNRAEKLVRDSEADPDKRRGFTEEEIKNIAETVGIAAVKYADLCQNRNTDYVFSWDKMLALQGNTAPYMLYAYARIHSIYEKGKQAAAEVQSAIRNQQSAITLAEPAERALALMILRLPETIDAVAESLLPNILCEYLYDLAGRFMTFYEACPVLQAPDDATRASRLRLCDLTARALRLGLALLGIRTLERM